MSFPLQALGDKYISSSYQDIVQQYQQSDFLYLLDGNGNTLFSIQSSSIGKNVITSDMTSSMTVATASYAVSYSYHSVTQSYIESVDTASYSYYAVESSIAEIADFAFNSQNGIFASSSNSSSFSNTSSYSSFAKTASYILGQSTTSSYSLYSVNSGLADISVISLTSSLSITSLFSDSASVSVNSDFANTSSYSLNSLTASYALNGGGGGPSISSSYSLTASYVLNGGPNIESGSSYNITASHALSSSWAPLIYSNIMMKTGIISGSVFNGNPMISVVVFDQPFPSLNYSVVVSGEEPRIFTITEKTLNGFTINSNSSFNLFNFVYWQAVNIDLSTERSDTIIPLKAGIINDTMFSGNPLSASVQFTTNFLNNEYSVVISGVSARLFTVNNKSINGFIVNSNSSNIFIGDVYWQAVKVGEYN